MTATRSLVLEKEFPQPPEKVWRALTQGPLIKEWLMENDFQPVVGHKFTFRSTPVPGWDGIINAEVLIVDPPKKLSYSWISMGLESAVIWTLDAAGGGTHVRMEQTGFGPEHDFAYKGATYGWKSFLGKL